MIKMIVFDMAGTTVNENNLVYRTLQKTINEAGFPVSLEEVLLHGAGKEKLQAIQDILHFASPGLADLETTANYLHKQFLAELERAYEEADISAFDTCEPLFEELRSRGIKVVLNTGYNRKTAKQLLNRLAWQEGQQIDLSVTADQVANSRPHPDMIHLAMQKMGIEDASAVAKVGDSIIDIEEGKNAGCGLTFGVTTGAHTAAQLASAEPDHVIDSLMEMSALI
jgi:phosphonatase-like hydrolase